MGAYFLFHYGFHEKIEPSRRNHLIWKAHWGGENNYPDTQNTLNIFLSAIAVIFWTEYNFRFISDCRYSFNYKLKKKTYKRRNNYFVYHFKCTLFIWRIRASKTFLSIFKHSLLTWFNLQIGSEFLLSMTHRVLTRLSKCANIPYHRNQMFL